MADAIFAEPRLTEIYDSVESDRIDLDAYLALADEFSVGSVLDLGCGTGTFACLLAQCGKVVTGVDPAAASIDVARRKRYADRVRWFVGDARSLPPIQVDLVTMTGNVAQVFLSDDDWSWTLRAVHSVLRPGGLSIFEVRDPANEAWLEWTPEHTYKRLELPQIGPVQTWVEVTVLNLPLVCFCSSFVFEADGVTLTSSSTLRFWTRTEIIASLQSAGLLVEDIRDAPDRPKSELVFIARRSE
jgi:SAM-dependent methyltransferase